jgi:DNA primase
LIPDAKISEIRQRTDLAELVGEYVTLKRSGANLKGVCPFHADSDPSFNVNEARQFFHCFGCSASGDAFAFLMRIEGLDFTEAAIRLAARAGVTLPSQDQSPEVRTKEAKKREARKRRHFILEEAAKFFEEALRSDGGAPARAAIGERNVSEETVARFRMGYAPAGWSSLIDYMAKQRQVSARELERVGLALPRKNGPGFYDRFRHRLMFTITDPGGQPIAFSGRVLDADEAKQGAKYINSPETEDYTKGHVLFGLHQARVAISKKREAILVEGNFDVLSMAEVGIDNVVAPLGTALTTEQALLLRRRVENVLVMFDGDDAGRKAARRAFPLLARAGIASYYISLPMGEDPDSVIRKGGAAGILERLSAKVGMLDQIVSDSAAGCDGSLQDKARRIEALKPYVSALSTPMQSDLYRGKIADAFGVDRRSVSRALGGARLTDPGPQGRPIREKPGTVEERALVGLIIDMPEFGARIEEARLTNLITSPSLKRVLERIAFLVKRQEFSLAEVTAAAGDERTATWISGRAMKSLYEKKEISERAFSEIVDKLTKRDIKQQLRELDNQIRLASSQGDDVRVLELSRKRTDLQRNSLMSVPKFDLDESSV